MVGCRRQLSHAVHGKNRVAHIDTAYSNARREYVAECAAACHITAVDKSLTWHSRLFAYLLEHCRRHGVCGILLCSVDLYDWSAA